MSEWSLCEANEDGDFDKCTALWRCPACAGRIHRDRYGENAHCIECGRGAPVVAHTFTPRGGEAAVERSRARIRANNKG